MTYLELSEAFKPVAERLERENVPITRILEVFETYVFAKLNNREYWEKRKALQIADELGI
jgi:hypothetical protein